MIFSKVWRFIPLLEAPGSVQMALDRWLFEQHCLGLHPPTLRFYTWKPAAISLGYHQRQYPKHWQNLTWQGEPVDLVRRPTGGRAVLHQGDLTYSVVMSGLPSSRMQSYQTVCEFLIQGWRSLGVELHYGHAGRGYIHNPNCFGTATSADLVTSDGQKIIGSAQLRKGDAVLQHGSMQLHPNSDLCRQVFEDADANSSGGEGRRHTPQPPKRQRAGLGMNSNSGRLLISYEPEIIQALTDAVKVCFGAELHNQPLSNSEWELILNKSEPSQLTH